MKILVTGGSGFIGKAVVEYLIKRKFEVNVLDLWNINIKGVHYFKGSILNKEDIYKATQGCDYVIHLAAILGVLKSTYRPIECLDVNILGTKNILDACLKYNVKKIVFSSSSETYGESKQTPIVESTAIQPKSEYGISKCVGEEYCEAYQKQFRLPYAILRFFNIYGIHQEPHWVISRFTSNAVLGKPIIIYGDGTQTRAFCNVHDAVEGVIKALFNEAADNQIINIGNSKEPISIKELAEKTMRLAGRTDKPIFIPLDQSDRTKDREIYNRIPDTNKAKNILDFEAKISLEEGIKNIIDYKKTYLKKIKKQMERIEKLEKEIQYG